MATLQIRVEDTLKEEAQSVLNGLGVDMTTAVRMFLRQLVNDNAFPFLPKNDPIYSKSALQVLTRRLSDVKAGKNLVENQLRD